jgi:hypothetical protein
MLNHKFDRNSKRCGKHLAATLCQAIALLITAGAMSFINFPAQAADGTYSFGGNAAVVDDAQPHPRAIQLPSTCSGRCLEGVPRGVLTTSSVVWLPNPGTKLIDLNHLSTDYRRSDGDCGGGSPRFEIGIDVNGDGVFNNNVVNGVRDGRVFVYLGPHPNFVLCSTSWDNTGNLIIPNGEERVDSTQVGGRFYGTWAQALGLMGQKIVAYIILVVDGSWYPNPIAPDPPGTPFRQILRFDNVRVNNDVLAAAQISTLTALQDQGPTIERLSLEEYATGVSGPREWFSEESYFGRRYSWRNTLRSLLQFSSRQTGRRSIAR